MPIQGRVWKFGDDVNTDEIIPGRYLNVADPALLAAHVMEDADPDFASKVREGDILVAGKNFGCGSSREHAPVAIKAAGISCVIAKSYSRIFYRNAFNMGLLIFDSPQAVDDASEGDVLEVDVDAGIIRNTATGNRFEVVPIPAFMKRLVRDGGLIAHLRAKAASRRPPDAAEDVGHCGGEMET